MKKHVLVMSLSVLLCGSLPSQAQLFGPSDEEKAREAGQDSQLATLAAQNQQLASRIQVLEDKSRSLTESLAQATGTNEELRHQLELVNQKIDQQQKDFSYRLCMVSAQQLGAGADDQGLNCAATGAGGGNTPWPSRKAITRRARRCRRSAVIKALAKAPANPLASPPALLSGWRRRQALWAR